MSDVATERIQRLAREGSNIDKKIRPPLSATKRAHQEGVRENFLGGLQPSDDLLLYVFIMCSPLSYKESTTVFSICQVLLLGKVKKEPGCGGNRARNSWRNIGATTV